MKRFFDNDPDDQNFLSSEGEDFEEPLQAEFTAFVNTEDFMNVMSMDLAELQLNQQLLIAAEKMARKGDWFWGFRSTEHQAEKIEQFYITMLEIYEKIAMIKSAPKGEGEKDATL